MPFNCDVCGDEVSYEEKCFTLRGSNQEVVICKNCWEKQDEKEDELDAYELGRDCGFNGANEENCNFKIFSTKGDTDAWTRGKKDAEAMNNGLD